MAVPAEKLNDMLDELLNKSSESTKALNTISLEEYKKLNADKIAYLNFFKKFVSTFNKNNDLYLGLLGSDEMIYLLSIFSNNYEMQSITKQYINEINESIFIVNIILDGVKNYPNKRLKTNSLKINDEVYKQFLWTKNRLAQIQQEIEENDFNPPDYMAEALENIEHIINKYEEYKDNPKAFLMILTYYYSDIDELEWTDEDRAFVDKHYG